MFLSRACEGQNFASLRADKPYLVREQKFERNQSATSFLLNILFYLKNVDYMLRQRSKKGKSCRIKSYTPPIPIGMCAPPIPIGMAG